MQDFCLENYTNFIILILKSINIDFLVEVQGWDPTYGNVKKLNLSVPLLESQEENKIRKRRKEGTKRSFCESYSFGCGATSIALSHRKACHKFTGGCWYSKSHTASHWDSGCTDLSQPRVFVQDSRSMASYCTSVKPLVCVCVVIAVLLVADVAAANDQEVAAGNLL